MKRRGAGFLACACAAALAGASCTERPGLPPPVEASAARPMIAAPLAKPKPLDAAETRAALESLRNATVVEHAKYVTTAANVASYESSLRKYEREAREVSLYERVPRTASPERLERSLREALAPLNLAPSALTIQQRPAKRRALPAVMPEGERFEPVADDVRGILDATFEVEGADKAKLALVAGKLASMRRLFYVSSTAPTAKGLTVRGEAYWFYPDFQVPLMEPRERSLDAALTERGVEPRKLRGDSEAERWLDELSTDFKAMRAKRREYARALRLQGELIRYDAQMRFARDRDAEARARAP